MNEPFSDSEISGIERFSHLEDRIFRVVEVFKALKKEVNFLRRESMTLKEENLKLRQEVTRQEEKIEEVKKRVEMVLTGYTAMAQSSFNDEDSVEEAEEE
jgi:regulator of replication initiation timing